MSTEIIQFTDKEFTLISNALFHMRLSGNFEYLAIRSLIAKNAKSDEELTSLYNELNKEESREVAEIEGLLIKLYTMKKWMPHEAIIDNLRQNNSSI